MQRTRTRTAWSLSTTAYQYAYERTKTESEGVQHPQFEGTVEGIFPLSVVARFGDQPATVLELACNPPMADVLVNGRQVGPFLFSEAKMHIRPNPVNLKQAFGSLEIVTDPGDVHVAIDGKRVGTTSRDGRLIVHNLQVAVPHTLELTKAGLGPESVVVSIPVSRKGKKFTTEKTRLARKEKDKGRPSESSERQRNDESGFSSRQYSRPEPREEAPTSSRDPESSNFSTGGDSSRLGL